MQWVKRIEEPLHFVVSAFTVIEMYEQYSDESRKFSYSEKQIKNQSGKYELYQKFLTELFCDIKHTYQKYTADTVITMYEICKSK